MRKFFCDICGKEIEEPDKRAASLLDVTPPIMYACSEAVADVCPECLKAGEAIDVAGLLMEEWRKRAGVTGGRGRRAKAASANGTAKRRGRRPRSNSESGSESAASGSGDGPEG